MNSALARVLPAGVTLVSLTRLRQLYATPVFSNEIHYDNAGADRSRSRPGWFRSLLVGCYA